MVKVSQSQTNNSRVVGTMANISDLIEHYLINMLKNSPKGYIEIQRNELAEQFNCVPSQINYVLSTRFTINHGYVIESRRGGGGYVKIEKIRLNDNDLLGDLFQYINNSISQKSANVVLQRLLNEEIITKREYKIMRSALERGVLNVKLPWRDKIRANILKAMIAVVLTEDE